MKKRMAMPVIGSALTETSMSLKDGTKRITADIYHELFEGHIVAVIEDLEEIRKLGDDIRIDYNHWTGFTLTWEEPLTEKEKAQLKDRSKKAKDRARVTQLKKEIKDLKTVLSRAKNDPELREVVIRRIQEKEHQLD